MDDFATGYALGQDSNGNGCNNGMFGGDWIWAIIILALFGWGGFGGFGGFGGGFGGGSGLGGALGSVATQADIQRGFDNQGVMNKLNGIEQGICSLGYDQLNQMNGINTNILQTGFGLQNAIQQNTVAGMQNTNALQTQLSNCCCETQRLIERGFCDAAYAATTNTTNIIQNAHNDTDRVIAKLNDMESARQQEKIEALRLENQSLKFAASQTAQNSYLAAMSDAQTAELIRRIAPAPVPAYSVPAPYPYTGCGNGCGCC